MPHKLEEVIARCQLFAEVGAERRQRLASTARRCRFDKGERIFRQGAPCPGVYIVDTGMVRVFKVNPNGKEHVLHMVGPGRTFGEVAAIGGFDCPAHAEAGVSTACVLLPLESFRRQMTEDHLLCLEMMTGMSFWVRHLIALLEDLVLRDAAGRLARFLLESEPNADQTVTLPGLKRHVASHLNLTSETFSRTMTRFLEAGLIAELDTNRVQLRDRARLRSVAEGLFPNL